MKSFMFEDPIGESFVVQRKARKQTGKQEENRLAIRIMVKPKPLAKTLKIYV